MKSIAIVVSPDEADGVINVRGTDIVVNLGKAYREQTFSVVNKFLENKRILACIRERYQKYEKDNNHIYVPLLVEEMENKSNAIMIGDKGFNTKDELITALTHLFEEHPIGVTKYANAIWNARNQPINVMVIVLQSEAEGTRVHCSNRTVTPQ